MDLDLKSRTALVSGASIGIGRAIAKGLAREGVRVVAVARRKDLLEKLAEECRIADGGTIIPVVQDIMEGDAATRLAAAAIDELGHVDILVNNAGGSRLLPIDAPEERLGRGDHAEFHPLAADHPRAAAAHDRAALGTHHQHHRQVRAGRLNAAFAAKAAVHAWAKGLSREIGQHGITVNSIPPGRIMSEQIRRNYPEDYRKRFAEEEIPVGYWGEPEDLAVMAVFLASPLARYITGAVIPVDGGLAALSVLAQGRPRRHFPTGISAAPPRSPRSRPAPPFQPDAPPGPAPSRDNARRRFRDRPGRASSGSPDILPCRRHTR